MSSANSRGVALVSKYFLLRFFVFVSQNFVESVPVSTLENVRLDRDSCSVCVSKCVCEHCLVQPLHVPGFRSHSCLAKRNNSTYCAAPMKYILVLMSPNSLTWASLLVNFLLRILLVFFSTWHSVRSAFDFKQRNGCKKTSRNS